MTNSNKLADALDFFWNAALHATHQHQDATANAVMAGMVEGIAAVASRLREPDEALAANPAPAADHADDRMASMIEHGMAGLDFSKPPQPAPAPVQVDELSEVASVIDAGGGLWRPCSGCYETSDGHNVHGFPFSEAFRCNQGGGCDECGGIGVVWENLDYAAMEDSAHPPAPAAVELPTQRESGLWGAVDRMLVDAYVLGGNSDEMDMLGMRSRFDSAAVANRADIASTAPAADGAGELPIPANDSLARIAYELRDAASDVRSDDFDAPVTLWNWASRIAAIAALRLPVDLEQFRPAVLGLKGLYQAIVIGQGIPSMLLTAAIADCDRLLALISSQQESRND